MKLVLGAWESPILTPDLNAGHLTAKPSAAAAAAPLHLPTPVTASGVKEEEEVEEDSFKKGGAESSSSSEKMILPLAKLGTLALKMMSKPIAIRLKSEASRHPRFRHLIINLAQVPPSPSLSLPPFNLPVHLVAQSKPCSVCDLWLRRIKR